MSIQSEINRISNAKDSIAASITAKGVTVPGGTKLDEMSTLIDAIPSGGGGGGVETCTIAVTNNYGTSKGWGLVFVYNVYENGQVGVSYTYPGYSDTGYPTGTTWTLQNVVVGTCIVIVSSRGLIGSYLRGDGESIDSGLNPGGYDSYNRYHWVKPGYSSYELTFGLD